MDDHASGSVLHQFSWLTVCHSDLEKEFFPLWPRTLRAVLESDDNVDGHVTQAGRCENVFTDHKRTASQWFLNCLQPWELRRHSRGCTITPDWFDRNSPPFAPVLLTLVVLLQFAGLELRCLLFRSFPAVTLPPVSYVRKEPLRLKTPPLKQVSHLVRDVKVVLL